MGNTVKLLTGELVEVLSKEEVLSTLDQNGCYEGMPFMPEMFQYCGGRFRVYKRAHKTCDFVTNTGGRSLPNAVHLENVRCDGFSHGNCQAQCLIFWKEAWLKRVPDESNPDRPPSISKCDKMQMPREATCSMEKVHAASTSTSTQPGDSDPTYVCQATLVPNFTRPLPSWDIRQYVEDYRSGNVTRFRYMVPRFIYRMYDNAINLGVGWGPILRWLYDRFQEFRGGRPYPARSGKIPIGSRTPTSIISLQPGDLVRVKSYDEILGTLDSAAKNRGMAFSAEMVPYCGKILRVLSRVTRIVDEKTGKMLHLKNPCIILEGATCLALYNKRMIFCPKATYPYWREIWLERLDDYKPPDTTADIAIRIVERHRNVPDAREGSSGLSAQSKVAS